MTIFFIGDTHFYHRGILKYEPIFRPFNCIEEHNEILIKNWNDVVRHKKDIVFHLGDVIFGGCNEAKILSRLMGDKRLILGNHDKLNSLAPYFTQVYGAKRYDEFLLTHIPCHENQLEFRFKYNIHGHMHSKNIENKRYINVSVEQINLRPISLEELRTKV